VLVAVLAGVGVAAFAGLAFAKSSNTTIKTVHNAKLGETILVDSHGRTVYELKPETTHHLLCTTKPCFMFWPPLTATKNAKLTKATGIKGTLGLLHRNGSYQVTLGGRPLYHFLEDKGKGQANGNGIPSFGGTWHVVTNGAGKPATTTTSTTTTSTTMGSTTTTSCSPGPPPYCY
jgi:predicted lipoprotein with Yx(FWY)xxD motif